MEAHLAAPVQAPAPDASILLRADHPESTSSSPTSVLFVLAVTASQASVGYTGLPPLQPVPLPRPVESCVRVLRAGEFIEVFLDEVLVISTRAYAGPCHDITARVDGRPAKLVIQPVIDGGTERDDLSAVTRADEDHQETGPLAVKPERSHRPPRL
jgi:hypothetical protein